MITVPVTLTAYDQNGAPVSGARVTARLDQTEIQNGFVVPELVEGTSDALGVCVLQLWPNALGVAGSMYRVQSWNPDTGKKYLDSMVSVPNSACNLHEILVQEPYPAIDAAQQVLMAAQAALAGATVQAVISTTGASTATEQADSAIVSADTATTQAVIAREQAELITSNADLTSADVLASAASAVAAKASEDSVAADARAAEVAMAAALRHAQVAGEHRVSAGGFADEAETYALAMASFVSAAAADRVQTGLDRIASAESVILATTQAGIAVENTALTSADAAATAANVVAATARANEAAEAAAFAASIASGPVISIAGLTGAVSVAAARTALSISTRSLLAKADSQSVAFAKTGAGTAQLKAGVYIDVNGTLLIFTTATTIVMPTLAAGTDYAIYACTDSTIRADASFSAPSGYNAATSRKIGGFHFAPGGNATARAGGDTTPAINEYSFWDLKFKPSCPDPRGLTLVADGFFSDIYLLGVDHHINGTSKYNVTIADGDAPPKIPTKFGGNGSNSYDTLNWWEAAEVMASAGKRLPTYAEFCALAFGTTEASSDGTDPGATILRAAYTSKWGVMLATGNLWQWGSDFGGGTNTGGNFNANTGGRGSTREGVARSATLGGTFYAASVAGSRCSDWVSPTSTVAVLGSRGVCDLLILE